MDWLTQPQTAITVLFMRLSSLASIAPPVLGIPAVLYGVLPGWWLPVLLGVSLLLSTTQVVVTQIIRLNACRKITSSQHALAVLEIEDLPHRRPK